MSRLPLIGLFALLLLSVSLAVPHTASAQVDLIAIYGDTVHTNCSVPWDFMMWFYVFHYAGAGASGCSFSVPLADCMIDCDGPYGGMPEFPNTTGHPRDGLLVQYDACLTGWIHAYTFAVSTTLPCCGCCAYPVLPNPGDGSGEVEVLDCDGGRRLAVTAPGIIDAIEICPCPTATGIPDPGVAWGTWARIKGLYR